MQSLKIAVTSDIHLGHKRNSTADIIYALEAAFPDNEETGELDIIFLAGDIYDRLLNLPEDNVTEIDIWIASLLKLCSKRNIVLRVLEGTPSHDWGQSNRFLTIRDLIKCNLDFQYINKLSIEHMDKFDINILYIPDEWDITTDRTLEQVKSLLASKGLEQVDYGIFHGQFDYQLPAQIKKIPRHDSIEYLKLVKEYIFIGHVHVYSTFDRIIAQGSFDRLSHGEEGPKGHVRATITDTDKQHFFIENKSARIYKTIDCPDLDLQKTLEYIREEVNCFIDGSCVRITADSNHSIFTNMNELVKMYPTIVWSKLPKSKDIEIEEIEEEQIHLPITITKLNIVSLVMNRVLNNNLSPDVNALSEKLLKEVI